MFSVAAGLQAVFERLFPARRGEIATAVPVVGRNIVAGSKRHEPTKRIERPPHRLPPATWHHSLDLDAAGPLSRDQLADFKRDGFVFLPEFYSTEALQNVQQDVEKMIDNLAKRLHRAGKINDLYEDLDWTSRLLRMRQDFPGAPVVLIKGGVLPVALQGLFSDPRILDIASQLGVGPDIALNPAWNLRAKMPSHEETVVPWHQDNSYWEPRIWDEEVLTVWVALVDATVENGCMQMVKGGHLSGKTASHTIGTSTSTWYTEVSEEMIAAELMGSPNGVLDPKDKVTIPAKAGSILIFPGTTPHRSLNSVSSNIRWSADFRLHRKTAARPGKTALDWFYGLKESLLLRGDPAKDPGHTPDWGSWATVDRTELQDRAANKEGAPETFDPVVVGPWMDLWDLEEDVRGLPNQHIDTYLRSDPSTRDPQRYIDKGHW